MVAVIFGSVMAGLFMIRKWDTPLLLEHRKYWHILLYAFLEECVILALTIGEPVGNRLFLAVLGGSLLLACVTDIAICQVYNFTWIPALAAASILFWHSLYGRETEQACQILQELVFFLFCQFVLFFRMYGRADGYAFCICAVAEAARGIKAAGFLLHMMLAYMLLFLVQALRGNINQKGNLIQPVPFLPYITVAFWLIIIAGQI